jgi:hypothetical protein
MTNVVPIRPSQSNVEKRLENLQECLDTLYTSLEQVYETLDVMHSHTKQVEGAYNTVLLEYSDIVDPDDIPEGYLDYATFQAIDEDEENA